MNCTCYGINTHDATCPAFDLRDYAPRPHEVLKVRDSVIIAMRDLSRDAARKQDCYGTIVGLSANDKYRVNVDGEEWLLPAEDLRRGAGAK